MSASSDYVRLQVLVDPSRRSDKGLDEVQTALRKLGLEVTGAGKASISARATPEVVAKVFGAGAGATSLSAASGGASKDLPVPAPLAEYVESITVAPQHIAMSERPQAGKRRDKT